MRATSTLIALLLASSAWAGPCGDVNNDGQVSVTDGVNVLRAAAGLSPSLECALAPANCVQRTADSATKISCGFESTVQCLPGEYALNGGMALGGNVALQNSSVVLDAGIPRGWTISGFDVAPGSQCSSNNFTATGTVVSGSPPSFPINGGSMTGAATVLCCR